MDGALIFFSERDVDLGKIAKKPRLNPLGENAYLRADGTVERDEDKIIAVQRIWKHEYYKPEGRGFLKGLKKFEALQIKD
jgi:hypothetical protein